MSFLGSVNKKELESLLKSFEITYSELRLLCEVHNERLFVVNMHSRFALYHALHNKYKEAQNELTSKFLMNYLKISFQTSQKILDNLTELGFFQKKRSELDRRIFIYTITILGEKSILLWESFKLNDYFGLKKVNIHNHGLLDMDQKRMVDLRKEFLEK